MTPTPPDRTEMGEARLKEIEEAVYRYTHGQPFVPQHGTYIGTAYNVAVMWLSELTVSLREAWRERDAAIHAGYEEEQYRLACTQNLNARAERAEAEMTRLKEMIHGPEGHIQLTEHMRQRAEIAERKCANLQAVREAAEEVCEWIAPDKRDPRDRHAMRHLNLRRALDACREFLSPHG